MASPESESAGFVAGGGPVTVEILESGSDYQNELYWSDDNWQTQNRIGTDNELGEVELQNVRAGAQLQFGIRSGDGEFYRTGGASANPDGVEHARSTATAQGVVIGFEDLAGGGDNDFDDARILVRGLSSESTTEAAAEEESREASVDAEAASGVSESVSESAEAGEGEPAGGVAGAGVQPDAVAPGGLRFDFSPGVLASAPAGVSAALSGLLAPTPSDEVWRALASASHLAASPEQAGGARVTAQGGKREAAAQASRDDFERRLSEDDLSGADWPPDSESASSDQDWPPSGDAAQGADWPATAGSNQGRASWPPTASPAEQRTRWPASAAPGRGGPKWPSQSAAGVERVSPSAA